MSPDSPLLDEFRRKIEALRGDERISRHAAGDEVRFASMTASDVAGLLKDDAGHHLLLSAAGLNRTSIRTAMSAPDAQIVGGRLRKAHVILQRLPVRASFSAVAMNAVSLRARDISRHRVGSVEGLFRDRLADEGIPIAMSPPARFVPGLLVSRRKPDGVYPDPSTGRAPEVYLEVKNIRRPADDIQKRLYELAEASLEMKILYGDVRLRGLAVDRIDRVESDPGLRRAVREQLVGRRPVVVGLLLCPREAAERHRAGAETFIDRVFFQEEVEECIRFLAEATGARPGRGS